MGGTVASLGNSKAALEARAEGQRKGDVKNTEVEWGKGSEGYYRVE